MSRESAREEHEDSSRASSHRESFTEVDMEDDEIIEIWKATHIEDDIPSLLSPYCHVCVEIVNPTATNATQKKMERKSFIDVEYERFKEIGGEISTKQRLLSKLKRKAFTACQA